MNLQKEASQQGEIVIQSNEESDNNEQKQSKEENNSAGRTKKIKKLRKRKRRSEKESKKDKPTKPFQFISTTYKTKKCQFYMKGACQKGSDCDFSHDFPIQKSDTICKFFLADSCFKGNNCFFNHCLKDYPCKFYHLEKKCQMGNNCKFSHQPLTNKKEDVDTFLVENIDFLIELYKGGRLNDPYLKKYLEDQFNQNPQKYQEFLPKGGVKMNNYVPPTAQIMNQGVVQNPIQSNYQMHQGNPGYQNGMNQGYYNPNIPQNYQWPQQQYYAQQQQLQHQQQQQQQQQQKQQYFQNQQPPQYYNYYQQSLQPQHPQYLQYPQHSQQPHPQQLYPQHGYQPNVNTPYYLPQISNQNQFAQKLPQHPSVFTNAPPINQNPLPYQKQQFNQPHQKQKPHSHDQDRQKQKNKSKDKHHQHQQKKEKQHHHSQKSHLAHSAKQDKKKSNETAVQTTKQSPINQNKTNKFQTKQEIMEQQTIKIQNKMKIESETNEFLNFTAPLDFINKVTSKSKTNKSSDPLVAHIQTLFGTRFS